MLEDRNLATWGAALKTWDLKEQKMFTFSSQFPHREETVRHTPSMDSPRLIIFLSLQWGEGEDGEKRPRVYSLAAFPLETKEWRINIPMSHLQQAGLSLWSLKSFSLTHTHMRLYAYTRVHTWLWPAVIFLLFRIYDNFFNSKRNKCINRENLQVRDCPQCRPVLSADPEVRLSRPGI